MHMWICLNCCGFGVADQRWQYIIGSISNLHNYLGASEVHSFQIIVQIVCLLPVGNQTKWESARKIFHYLAVLRITFNVCSWNNFLLSVLKRFGRRAMFIDRSEWCTFTRTLFNTVGARFKKKLLNYNVCVEVLMIRRISKQHCNINAL